MKLRSRSTHDDVPNTTPKRARTEKKLNEFEEIFPGAITSYGQFGMCQGSDCDGVPSETVKIGNERFCEKCAKTKHSISKTTLFYKFEKSDAEFKCPSFTETGSCKSRKISFREFFLGSCCEKASKWLTTNEKAQRKKLAVIREFHVQAKGEKTKAKNKLDDKKKKIEEIENSQVYRKKTIREISKTIQETDKEIAETKKVQEKTEEILKQKDEKLQFVAKRYKQVSYEYYGVSCQEYKADENENAGKKCRVCMEEYGDDWFKNKMVLRGCGHVACRRCLEQIIYNDDDEDERGRCPHCRQWFYEGTMIKIHE
ncbi:Oidioi.mRNA.OKI2018_I69.chr2.g7276.t1.cds [Oikopleura dioica]|uniref:Oidioi.mRNA.OKI2018_I69.chr2.g7276.t1.cds n=1 Tax=Oikopleura dioica TaxID=34765 RepID=A0ABN7T5M3_OIKDI|nr:Oidioi.mRNA.OKI2018_I69.chr2.g7276.t1.cds [Oikopleura dioica]